MAKLTVEFPERLNTILEEMAEKEGLPKVQLIRRAIALLKYVEDEKALGNKIAIADENNKIIKEIVTGTPS
jgi:hypothetical protein